MWGQVAARIRGKVGDGSGEIELGGGLVAPDVPGLPQTQLRQLGLAEVAIGCESRTELEGAGGLQQGFCGCRLTCRPRPHSGGGAGRGYRAPRQSGKGVAAHAPSGGRFLAGIEVSRYYSVSEIAFLITIEVPTMNSKRIY